MMSISLVAVEIVIVMCDTCCLVANETKNMFKDCVKDYQVKKLGITIAIAAPL